MKRIILEIIATLAEHVATRLRRTNDANLYTEAQERQAATTLTRVDHFTAEQAAEWLQERGYRWCAARCSRWTLHRIIDAQEAAARQGTDYGFPGRRYCMVCLYLNPDTYPKEAKRPAQILAAKARGLRPGAEPAEQTKPPATTGCPLPNRVECSSIHAREQSWATSCCARKWPTRAQILARQFGDEQAAKARRREADAAAASPESGSR